MIARIWHGYITKENADRYENLLKEEVFTGIEQKNIKGYKGIRLLRRELADETEFTTIMQFESMEDVEQRQILKRFDPKSVHCQIIYELNY